MSSRLRRLFLGSTLGLCLAGSAVSSTAWAQTPEPRLPDNDALPPPAARTKVFVYGGGFLAGFYGVSLASSFLWPNDPGASDLQIPFAGPWMKLGQTALCSDLPERPNERPCNDVSQVVGAVAVTILGIGQAASAVFLLEGIFMKTGPGPTQTARGLSPYRAMRIQPTFALHPEADRGFARGIQAGQIRLWPIPVATSQMTGLGVVGQF